MSFDGIFLHHMTQELSEHLTGGRIQKINQVFDHELVPQVRKRIKNPINYYYLHTQLLVVYN